MFFVWCLSCNLILDMRASKASFFGMILFCCFFSYEARAEFEIRIHKLKNSKAVAKQKRQQKQLLNERRFVSAAGGKVRLVPSRHKSNRGLASSSDTSGNESATNLVKSIK